MLRSSPDYKQNTIHVLKDSLVYFKWKWVFMLILWAYIRNWKTTYKCTKHHQQHITIGTWWRTSPLLGYISLVQLPMSWASLLCTKMCKNMCLQCSNYSATCSNESKMSKNSHLASFFSQFGRKMKKLWPLLVSPQFAPQIAQSLTLNPQFRPKSR